MKIKQIRLTNYNFSGCLLRPLIAAALLLTVAQAECVGEREGVTCFNLAGSSEVLCAKHDGCYYNVYGDFCDGIPNKCDSFLSKHRCMQQMGCDWEGDDDFPPGTITAGGELIGVYKGIATSTLSYYSFYNHDQLLKEETHQCATEIEILTPKKDDTHMETNPFSFFIKHFGGVINDEGCLFTVSAHVMTTATNRQTLMLQYWDFDMMMMNDNNNAHVQGIFTDTHGTEGRVYNTIGAEGFGPYSLAVGTTLEGTMTPTSTELTIAGKSTDNLLKFVTKIEGSVEEGGEPVLLPGTGTGDDDDNDDDENSGGVVFGWKTRSFALGVTPFVGLWLIWNGN